LSSAGLTAFCVGVLQSCYLTNYFSLTRDE